MADILSVFEFSWKTQKCRYFKEDEVIYFGSDKNSSADLIFTTIFAVNIKIY